MEHYDIIIIGGGMIGASLAHALAKLPLKIAVIEANAPVVNRKDMRSVVLSESSRRVFTGMELWATLSPHITTIQEIHVSERGQFGFTRLRAKDHRLAALGYVLPMPLLNQTLQHAVQAHDHIHYLYLAKVQDLSRDGQEWQLTIAVNDEIKNLSAKLIVAADGSHSVIRTLCGIATVEKDYQQSAVITNVITARDHNNVAYERFSATGPLAFLPFAKRRCAVIWTVTHEDAAELLASSEEIFIQRLQACFGQRLGKILQVEKYQAYPLKMICAKQRIQPGLVLMGNAAHTLHPIAAQGFNLGLRDVATLAQVIADALRDKKDFSSLSVLQHYDHWRENDQQHTSRFTDNLIQLFAPGFLPWRISRNLGLIALDILPPLKRSLLSHATGIAGRLPKLLRGLPLISSPLP